jgi:signal peptidase II
MRANLPRLVTGFALAGLVFAADQAVKYWVLTTLAFSPPGCLQAHVGCGRIELSAIFDLTMVWNHGVSFGLFRADSPLGRWILVAVTGAIAAGFSLWLTRTRRPLRIWALGAIVGGAAGNLIDRILYGAVADFFDFSGLGFPWVFNVADAAINVGAALLLIDFLLEGRSETAPGKT